MKGKALKYVIGFGIFAGYYLIMRQIENRVSVVKKLAGAA